VVKSRLVNSIANRKTSRTIRGVGLFVFLLAANICLAGHTQNIMITGYWPPTNEMLREFSTDPNQNPGSWQGQNWEGRGYDIYAFFPEFPGGTSSNPKGNGDFEIDYQDVGSWNPPSAPTGDFWRLTSQVHPVALISYGQGAGPWEIECNARNLSKTTDWTDDYRAPYDPNYLPPDNSVPSGYVRHSSLPVDAIAAAVNSAGLGINAWVDWDGDPGHFLCEYMAYHDGWYQSLHSDPNDQYYCVAAGFTHLAAGVSVSNATAGVEAALRATIAYLDSQLIKYTISGTITSGGSPLAGVTMCGLPGNPTTNSSGVYTALVGGGWSGAVTPLKAGYAFNSSQRTYTNVRANQSAQDYTASTATADTIEFDAASSNYSASAGTTLSWSHTVSSGNNRLLVVGIVSEDATPADQIISSVKFNGVSMTLVPDSTKSRGNASSGLRTDLYYMLNPPVGTFTVLITYNGSVSYRVGGAISLRNIKQQVPEAVITNSASSATTISTNITVPNAGAWIVDVVGHSNSGSFTTSTSTERWDRNSGSHTGAGSTKAVSSPGSNTVSWTYSGSSGTAIHSLAAFAPSETVGSPPSQATSPTPTSGATGVSITNDLSWTAGSGATSHDVYFGTNSSSLPLVSSAQTATTYDTGTMSNNTTYYWRIDERNGDGVTTGIVWNFTTIVAAPGQASNPNPANSATTVSITNDLSWTAGSGATSHDVYFGTNSSSLPLVSSAQTATTYDTGTMSNNTTYYWRINERNAGGTTTGQLWNFITIVAAPGQASSPSPTSGATGVSITNDLSWTAGSGATSSDVYFGTAASPPLVSSSQTATTFDTGTMNQGTTYYWRIDEKNAGGTTTGVVWNFTTVHPPPGQASNPNPANSATNVSITNDLSWTAGSGATSHDVYFGTNSSSLPLVSSAQTATTYDTGTMNNNTTYSWRIDEKNTGGTTTGIVWSFTTIVAAPGQASNPNPANSATNVSITNDLSWTAGSGATSHDVYFGTSSPGAFQGNQTATTFDTGTMNPNTTYYWRIDEKNAGGTTTGTVWSLTTVPPPPAQAANPNPANSATNVSITNDLSWTAGSGATSHDVYLGTNSSSLPLVSSAQTATTYDTGTMNTNTTYYWRIDEKNAGGTTTGTLWHFTTKSREKDSAGHVNPDRFAGSWCEDANVVDDNDLGTGCNGCAYGESGTDWFYMYYDQPVAADSLRYAATDSGSESNVQINCEVYYTGGWHNILLANGGYSEFDGQYHNIAFGDVCDVNGVRWRVGVLDPVVEYCFNLLEVDLFEGNPIADFAATTANGTVPFTVSFTDQSSGGITSWSWSFGDTGTSTAQNPTHQYAVAGTYTVSMTVHSPIGSDVETKVVYPVDLIGDIYYTGGTGNPIYVNGSCFLGPEIYYANGKSYWLWERNTGNDYTNMVCTYDHSTGLVSSAVDIGNDRKDQHGYGAVTVTADGYVVVATGYNLRRSNSTYSIAAFTDKKTINIEYPNLQKVGSRLYCFGEQSHSEINLYYSDNQGSTWSAGVVAADVNTGYWSYPVAVSGVENKLRIIINLKEFPDGNYVYTYYLDSNDGDTFYNLDRSHSQTVSTGGRINKVALDAYYKLFSTESGYQKSVNSCYVDSTGKIYFLAAKLSASSPYNCQWQYLYFEGSTLTTKTIVDFNGVPVTTRRPDVIWSTSAGVDFFARNTVSGKVELQRWRSTDNGDSWSKIADPTSGSDFSHGTIAATANYDGSIPGLLLAAYKDGGSSFADIRLKTIAEKPAADFSGTPINGNIPLTVAFTDSSTNTPTAWNWDFGDITTSTEQNPSHTYTSTGTYTVSLTASNAGGSDIETKTNYITVTTLPPVPNFSGTPTSGFAPLTVNFTDASAGEITGWSWNFGDSPTSTAQNPSHNYQTPGTFSVSLTVSGPGGSNTSTRTNYISVIAPAPGQASNPSPANGATNISNTADLSWTAGLYATSHDVYFGTNPTPGPSQYKGNQAGTIFDPGTLSYNTTYYWRIDEKNASGTTTGVVWSFTTVPPPPAQAVNPNPANLATNISTLADLLWTAGSGATSHDVYFGTSSPGTFRCNQTGTLYDPGTLNRNTTYYWRINEKNAGGTTTGTVWSFTTVPQPPAQAANPSPANLATNVSLTNDLSWTAGSGATSHDVYFGTSSPGTFRGNRAATTFDTGTMNPNTTYYWRIDEKNAGGTTTGTVWSFTTGVLVPNVVGMTQANANSTITGAGLTLGNITQAYSNTVPAGSVISQNPSAGTQVPPGSSVDMAVSLGKPKVPCFIIGMTQADAIAAIMAIDNLVVGTVTQEYSDTVPAGNIIRINPPCDTEVNIGSGIDITVSLGRPVVPDVVGMTQAAAIAAITAVDNLKVGTVTQQYSNNVPAGNVISQNPAGGTEVNIGSNVDIIVSLGKPKVPCFIIGMTQADASAAIIAIDNLVVGTVTQEYSDTVPAGNIIRINPPCDTEVNIGSSIDITISLGRPVVPDVVGMTQAAASAAITAVDNLVVGTVSQSYSDTVAAGLVISQSPTGGTEVNTGSAIDLVISLGLQPPADNFNDNRRGAMWRLSVENNAGIIEDANRLNIGAEQQLDLMPSCTGHWTMNDNAANTTVTDSSGNNHNGTAQRNTDILHTTGKIDGALIFNGSTDYVAIGDIIGTGAYTKAAWVKLESSTSTYNHNILSGKPSQAFWAPNWYGNKLSAGHNSVWNQVQDSNSLAFGTWYFVAVTYDATAQTLTLYKNGTAVSTGATTTPQPLTELNIGRYDNTATHLKGSIDNVMLFNRALTTDEIAALYNAGAGTETVPQYTTSNSEYSANSWSIDPNENFQAKVDYHYSAAASPAGRIGMTIENNYNNYVSILAGADGNSPYFQYEQVVNGTVTSSGETSRTSNDGTIYISYNAASDELYLSYTGYGSANAWQTISGLLDGQWLSNPLGIALGGGSDGGAIDDGQAYLDNFEVDSGSLLDWPVPSDLNNDGYIDLLDIKVMSEHWLEIGSGITGDLNGDETVNFIDFAEITIE